MLFQSFDESSEHFGIVNGALEILRRYDDIVLRLVDLVEQVIDGSIDEAEAVIAAQRPRDIVVR